jgi:hypothetical protein
LATDESILNATWPGWRRQAAIIVLALLLALDVALIWLHVLWAADDWYLDLGVDRSYPEVFQYLKWGAASALLLALAWKRRAWIYAIWSVLFLYMLVDDSSKVHERTGKWLVKTLDLRAFEEIYQRHFEYFMLYAQDFGEMIVALALGTATMFVLLLSWPARDAVRERVVTKRLIAWVVLFAFFAVGIDMLHVMAWEIYPPAIELLAIVEDGGEMICASLLVGGLALELART